MQTHLERVTQSQPPSQEPLLKPEVVAQHLNISIRTLEAWRYRGVSPKYIRISARCIRYRMSDVLTWQHGREQQNTSMNGSNNG